MTNGLFSHLFFLPLAVFFTLKNIIMIFGKNYWSKDKYVRQDLNIRPYMLENLNQHVLKYSMITRLLHHGSTVNKTRLLH